MWCSWTNRLSCASATKLICICKYELAAHSCQMFPRVSARTLYFSKHRCWMLVIMYKVRKLIAGRWMWISCRGSKVVWWEHNRLPARLWGAGLLLWRSWSSLKRQTERLIWDYKRSASVPKLNLSDLPSSQEESVNIYSRNETTDFLFTSVMTGNWSTVLYAGDRSIQFQQSVQLLK